MSAKNLNRTWKRVFRFARATNRSDVVAGRDNEVKYFLSQCPSCGIETKGKSMSEWMKYDYQCRGKCREMWYVFGGDGHSQKYGQEVYPFLFKKRDYYWKMIPRAFSYGGMFLGDRWGVIAGQDRVVQLKFNETILKRERK